MPPVTSAWLERVALHYLDRYSASAGMLRRTLARRVDKRARARGEESSAFAELIEECVARAVRAGLVDDARFTQSRLATLRRRGTSTRAAGAKLAAKGVDRETIAAALAQERDDAQGAGEGADDAPADGAAIERDAARAYARRRRLGPYRRPDTRAAHRDRDLAALARAGFSYGLAREVVDGEV